MTIAYFAAMAPWQKPLPKLADLLMNDRPKDAASWERNLQTAKAWDAAINSDRRVGREESRDR